MVDVCLVRQSSAIHLALFAKGAALLAPLEEAAEGEGGGEGAEGGTDAQRRETSVAVQRHILRTAAAEAVDLLLRYEELQCDEVAMPEDPRPALDMTTVQRKAVIMMLPGDLKGPTTSAVETLNGASLADMQSALDGAVSAAGLRLKRPDKKTEKSAIVDIRAKLSQQLSAEGDPAAALALVVPLLFLKYTGRLVSVPGRAITGVIAYLEGSMPEDAHQVVLSYHKDVVAHLKSRGEGDGPEALQRLEEKLPALKALCVASES